MNRAREPPCRTPGSAAAGVRDRRGARVERLRLCPAPKRFPGWSPAGRWQQPPCAPAGSRARTADAVEVRQANENVPRLGAVGRSQYTRRMQLVDDSCRASVTDLEAALEK